MEADDAEAMTAAEESVAVEPEVVEGPTTDVPLEDVASSPDSRASEPGAADADAEAGDPRDDEIARLKNKLARAVADYDNLQKRTQRDAALERERVKARVLENFLQVFEYGRMAATEAEKQPGPLAEGVKMIVREFERLLEGEGVQTIGAVGDKFDGALHEAVLEEAAEGVEAGHISRVIQPGYLLGERVLKYAKVAVAPSSS